MHLHLERYEFSLQREWDSLVRRSANGTFIQARDYMDYHRERFEDHSLVARSDDGSVIAVLPAHLRDGVLNSHSGLTYGGWVVDESVRVAAMREIWRLMIAFLQGADVRRLIYRPSPYIYHSRPCQDDLYWLGACGGRVVGRSPLSVVPISAALRYQERRRRGVASARRAGVEVGESSAWDEYWMLLIDVLAQRHGASPVHSSEEIGYLQRRFPGNIRLFEARAGETKVAGVVVYDSGIVARAQYIAANEDGRKLHALDLLFDHLIREVFKERRYLDLGSSDGVAGSRLNDSLVEFKEGFGGRTVVLDTYELELRDAVIRTE